MSYRTFISYARADRQDRFECVKRFVDDLQSELRLLGGGGLDEACFFDTRTIDLGEVWKPELAAALCTSKTMVCLCSRSYFNSEYCGKEFSAFLGRIERRRAASGQQKDVRCPPLVFPLLWVPTEWIDLPGCISKFQYDHDDLPATYQSEGIHQMVRLKHLTDDYWHFVRVIAGKIVKASDASPLEPCVEPVLLRDVRSPFHTMDRGLREAVDSFGGPDTARFLFVVGTDEDVSDLDCRPGEYGACGSEWKPFAPEMSYTVRWMAQNAASSRQMRYEELSFANDIEKSLHLLSKRNESVIAIVDPSSLAIEQYRVVLEQYDRLQLDNSGIVVFWGMGSDNRNARVGLSESLTRTLPNTRAAHGYSEVQSFDDVTSELVSTLVKVRNRILARADPGSVIEDKRIVDLAGEQGIRVDQKPIIQATRIG